MGSLCLWAGLALAVGGCSQGGQAGDWGGKRVQPNVSQGPQLCSSHLLMRTPPPQDPGASKNLAHAWYWGFISKMNLETSYVWSPLHLSLPLGGDSCCVDMESDFLGTLEGHPNPGKQDVLSECFGGAQTEPTRELPFVGWEEEPHQKVSGGPPGPSPRAACPSASSLFQKPHPRLSP